MKLTIIGSGNMGGAIALGLSRGSLLRPSEITCADASEAVLSRLKSSIPEVQTTVSNIEAVRGADVVILAVKPWLSGIVLEEIRSELDYGHQLLISIVSGLSFDKMVEILCNEHKKPPVLFRLIPNTAIGVCRSMTFISSFGASAAQVSLVESLFNELGVTMLVEERMMPACTSLSSCGIAYAFRYIRAAMSGGVELGISADQSKSIVLQTLKGAVALLESTGSHPEVEIDRVTTPGGITIRGLNEMERCGFTSSVISGLKASV